MMLEDVTLTLEDLTTSEVEGTKYTIRASVKESTWCRFRRSATRKNIGGVARFLPRFGLLGSEH